MQSGVFASGALVTWISLCAQYSHVIQYAVVGKSVCWSIRMVCRHRCLCECWCFQNEINGIKWIHFPSIHLNVDSYSSGDPTAKHTNSQFEFQKSLSRSSYITCFIFLSFSHFSQSNDVHDQIDANWPNAHFKTQTIRCKIINWIRINNH